MRNQASFSLSHLSRPPLKRGEGKAPALLLLHGVGSNEEDLMGLAPYLDPRYHILSARAPITMGPAMFGWYWIERLDDGSFHYEPEEAHQSLRLLGTFIDEIVTAYDLDPTRLFLVGFSQGAILGCGVLLTRPEKVGGVVAMSGRWPEAVEGRVPDEQLVGKPVLVTHGLHDPVIPIRDGRRLNEELAALPVALTYQEFPMGHTVSHESLQLVSGWVTDRLEQG